MDNIVFNKQVALLQERFPTQFIPLDDVAEYLGPCRKTLEAMKGFPVSSVGNRKGVFLIRLAEWLAKEA